MRTLVWSSTAVVLLVAGGMFVVARHAAQNPDSFVGRCALAVYHAWQPLTGEAPKPVQQVAQAPQSSPTPAGGLTPDLEVIEPIVVEPTDQEPPLAFPRLSPEIAAALERLRGEEESEAPPQPFDGPAQALHMPYADEEAEVEILPFPTVLTETDSAAADSDLPGATGFFFLPPEFWQKVYDQVMDSVRQTNDVKQGGEEPAEEGTGTEDSSDLNDLQQVPYHNYHENSCPYSGCYPSQSYYRTMYPVAPQNDPPAPATPSK